MKLKNIHGFNNLDEYVKYKFDIFEKKEKNFEALFELMFDERDNVMVETTDGYRINRITYGEFKDEILSFAPKITQALKDVPAGEIVGLYMANDPKWLVAFWGLLVAGYCPLLMNIRLSQNILEDILAKYSIKAVLSDGTHFSNAKTVLWDALPEAGAVSENRPFGKEVLFMSSGTTGHVKLCGYTAGNFYYQILDSTNIIAACPNIKRNYEGELKHLVLLPLYHVFGFIAVYLWFGFFARTFVFPKDLAPATIQRTVKKHKVTHIFAVPMVWDAVQRAAKAKIRARGDDVYKKFLKAIKAVNSLDAFCGDFFAQKLLREVREGLFGDSIMFLISGGSHIEPSTLEFFNGIGYHIANGYGMTEIGITSLERSCKKKILNTGSIGAPFNYTKYSLNDKGHLLVRGKTRASRILYDGNETILNDDEWFDTGDMMQCRDGRYFALGRTDDIIICEDGENLNPTLAERSLSIAGIDKLCIFQKADKTVAIVASVPGCFAAEKILSLSSKLNEKLSETKLDKVIRTIYFTGDSLLAPDEFKLSHKKIAARIHNGDLRVFLPNDLKEHGNAVFVGLEKDIAAIFAEVLNKEVSEIDKDSHFFHDLGGTSMDYYALLSLMRERLGTHIEVSDASGLATVSDFYSYLIK